MDPVDQLLLNAIFKLAELETVKVENTKLRAELEKLRAHKHRTCTCAERVEAVLDSSE
jgi:hypothetical protein